MRAYDRLVVPWLVDVTCACKPQMRQRQKLVPAATGRVLEIGFGSGLNAAFYDRSRVESVWALEPAPEMWLRARDRVALAPVPIEHVEASAERIPLPDGAADTVVVTYTLCTIQDTRSALVEARRVLKRGGRLLFCEHGAAPDEDVLRWQNRLNRVWSAVSGGCNLNRRIPELLADGGFRVVDLSTMYVPGWRWVSFNYWGTAVPG